MKPGDVVFCNFPGAMLHKPRPSIVVSSENYHDNRPDVILLLLTSQVQKATAPSDYSLQDWLSAGLHKPSAARCFLATIPASGVTPIGRLSDRDWLEVQARLRLALAV